MVRIFDAFETIRKNHEKINQIVNPPVIQHIKKQSEVVGYVNKFAKYLEPNKHLLNVGGAMSGWSSRVRYKGLYNNEHLLQTFSPTLKGFETINKYWYQNKYNLDNRWINKENNYSFVDNTTLLNLNSVFKDITLDSLNVLEEIFKEYESPDIQDATELQGSLTVKRSDLVADMTKEELRSEISDVMESAQAKLNKNMTKQERLKTFFVEILDSYKQDVAKFIINNIITIMLHFLYAIALYNHDSEIAKKINQGITENEQVTTLKKYFINNPDTEKPLGDMAFLRIESPLRTQPQKNSHIASNGVINKNTVVIPVHQKGDWVLIEVETIGGFFTGWIEESKLIKFKLK